jgi:N-acyl-D-amino-acid deacylase
MARIHAAASTSDKESIYMDVLLTGVDVIDGSGSSPYHADVAMQGDRIVAIGDLSGQSAATVIDGRGLVAAPGFIDMHSHSDSTLPINPQARSKIHQGVTTEVVGMCGGSPAPLNAAGKERRMRSEPRLPWSWDTFGTYLDVLRSNGISVNVIPVVGHGTVREYVLGLEARPPTPDELDRMARAVSQAMDEGAWGLSTGLIYPPSVYADTEELVALSRVAAARGGFYFSHIRGESETLLHAIAEAIEIGERAGLPIQIAHFKAMDEAYWSLLPDAIELIDRARARGVDVAADRYPYIASSTSLAASLPHWAHDGGRDALLARLRDPAQRQRVHDDPVTQSRRWERTVISYAPGHAEWEGHNVAELAAGRGQDAAPAETAFDLLLEGEGRVSVIHFGMCEENLAAVLRHPAVMIGSDGSALSPVGPLGEGKAHPRNYGTFPRVLGKYAREKGVLSLPEAVHKMTGLPAARIGLRDRGLLRVGWAADLVLLNPGTVRDMATFDDPYRYPEGIDYVFVNGEAVVTPDGHSGALPGRVLDLAADGPAH